MWSPDDDVDRMIDEVAQTLTSAPHRDLARSVADRIAFRRRTRSPLLIAALAGGVAIVLAAVAVLVVRAPGLRVQPGSGAPVPIAQTDRQLPSSSQHPAPSTRHSAPGTQHPTAVRQQPVAGIAVRRQLLPPPFVTDLSPAPLAVAPVPLAPIDAPEALDVAEIEVHPIPVPPVETKGGTR
jgi:hypothetical protein